MVVDAVAVELRKVRKKIFKPGVGLNVYRSKHHESEVLFQRIVIK
jgi:hypothetical protein